MFVVRTETLRNFSCNVRGLHAVFVIVIVASVASKIQLLS